MQPLSVYQKPAMHLSWLIALVHGIRYKYFASPRCCTRAYFHLAEPHGPTAVPQCRRLLPSRGMTPTPRSRVRPSPARSGSALTTTCRARGPPAAGARRRVRGPQSRPERRAARCAPLLRACRNSNSNSRSAEDDSPYPEVRSAVANTDDPDMPCATFRAWFIGIVWAVIIPGLNQFFFFRFPSVTITGVSPRSRTSHERALTDSVQVVAQLITFPIVRLWARFVPGVKIFGVSLNPGPFTVKEHVLITIMASVGYQSAYAVRVLQPCKPDASDTYPPIVR